MVAQSQFIEMFGGSEANKSKVGDVCKIVAGKTVPLDIENEGGPIAYLKVADMNLPENERVITTSSRFVSEQTAQMSGILPKGATVFPKNGAAAMHNKKRITSVLTCVDMNTMGVFSVSEKLDPEFLFAFLEHQNLAGLTLVGAIPQIRAKDVAKLDIPVPSISAQKKYIGIVHQADKSKFDGLKSQFIEMFSGREYPQLPIRDFADITTGSTPSKSHPKYWGGSNPWVSAEDMKDKYVYDTVEKVTDKGYATCKHIPVNTLMYVCRGSIGVMAINKVECATNQSICTATCKADKCEVEFLYHSLLYKKDEIKQIGIGTNFKSLNQTTFSNLRIFLPPIEEQRRFVSVTTQADKSKYLS